MVIVNCLDNQSTMGGSVQRLKNWHLQVSFSERILSMSDQYGGGYFPRVPDEPWRRPVGRPSPPPSVLYAVRLMFARAGLGLVGILAGFATTNTLRKEILRRHPSFDAGQVDNVVNLARAASVAGGIVFFVLFVLLALQVKQGKSWARTVTLVLAVVGIIGGLLSFLRAATAVSHLITLASILLDVCLIVLLTRGGSAHDRHSPP
jgi:hypothetical protein